MLNHQNLHFENLPQKQYSLFHIRVKEKILNLITLDLLWPLFSKFLIPGLTSELDKPLDDWLKSTSLTNHLVGYFIRKLTRKLKI